LASEFAVVFLGVLVALGVDQWWDIQQDRALEQAYYGSLLEDLMRDTSEYRTSFEVMEESAQIANEVLDASLGLDEFPANGGRLYRASFFNFPQRSTATIDELMSSGNLRLLRDDSIKSAMLAYYRDVDEWQPRLRGVEFTQSTLDYRQTVQDLVFRLTPRDGVPVLDAAALGDELRQREQLPAILGTMLQHQSRQLLQYKRQLDQAEALIALLPERHR